LKEINKACSLKGFSRNNMFCFYRSRKTAREKAKEIDRLAFLIVLFELKT